MHSDRAADFMMGGCLGWVLFGFLWLGLIGAVIAQPLFGIALIAIMWLDHRFNRSKT